MLERGDWGPVKYPPLWEQGLGRLWGGRESPGIGVRSPLLCSQSLWSEGKVLQARSWRPSFNAPLVRISTEHANLDICSLQEAARQCLADLGNTQIRSGGPGLHLQD